MMGTTNHFGQYIKKVQRDSGSMQPPSSTCLIKQKKYVLPFNATQQHVKNVGLLIQCEECLMWRLLFSKKKLDLTSKTLLEKVLQDISYTCGASFDDLNLPENLTSVYVKYHNCYDPVEKLYYSTGYQAICIYCCSEDLGNIQDENSKYYPQCENCSSRPVKCRPRCRVRTRK